MTFEALYCWCMPLEQHTASQPCVAYCTVHCHSTWYHGRYVLQYLHKCMCTINTLVSRATLCSDAGSVKT